MSTDEYLTEVELYGVSPWLMSLVMLPLTLLNIIYAFMTVMFDSLLSFWFIMPAVPLHILFGIWFVRYYQAKSSKDSALILGILSVILPTFIHLYVSIYMLALSRLYVVIFPLPIQFLAGLLILRRIDGPEVISPWSGMRLDLSWWKFGQPQKKSDWDPLGTDKKDQETEDWLEE
jgi:hypothetical protein